MGYCAGKLIENCCYFFFLIAATCNCFIKAIDHIFYGTGSLDLSFYCFFSYNSLYYFAYDIFALRKFPVWFSKLMYR